MVKLNFQHSDNDGLQKFRLIYFSVLASSVLIILPLTLRVNGLGYLFFLAIILFHTLIETYLKLDEGSYIDKIHAPRVAFFADIFFVVPIIVGISYFVKYYCDEILILAEQNQMSPEILANKMIHPEKLLLITTGLGIMFFFLLLRGVLDIKLLKDRVTIATEPYKWITAHISAIIVCIITIYLLKSIEDLYIKLKSIHVGESISSILSTINTNSLHLINEIDRLVGIIQVLSISSVVILTLYLFWTYLKAFKFVNPIKFIPTDKP